LKVAGVSRQPKRNFVLAKIRNLSTEPGSGDGVFAEEAIKRRENV
jgi:hypothetical protein